MSKKYASLRRAMVGVGVVTLALAGTVMASSAAQAEVGPDQPEAPSSGSLVINKYSGSPVDQGETPDPNNLLNGVEFTVTQVGRTARGSCAPINLKDAAQWAGLQDLFRSAPAAPAGDFCEITPGVAQKTVDGTTKFDLDVGVYYVQETDSGENNIVSKVPNFYVSIPTSEGETGDGWNYNVIADPKNQVMEQPSKKIDKEQKDIVIGDTVSWTMSIPIPALNNNEKFTTASVADKLDPRLVYAGSVLSIEGTELVEGTHYEVENNGVTWTFSAAGLSLLDNAMGKTLAIKLNTTVSSVGDGSVPNKEYSSEFNGTTVPGEKVPFTYWGQLSIYKHDDSATKKPLKGAEFQIFPAASDDTCPADAPGTGSIATGVSDSNGTVQWADVTPANVLGLWVANSPDGPLTDPSKQYCVYETVVPAGHTAMPISNPVKVTPGEANILKLEVNNPKTQGPDLPLTGAGGTAALTIGGLLVMAAGAATILIQRRRKATAQASI